MARFSVFPSEHCAPTLALWYAHTHAIEQFYVTPRLVLDSAEPGSGKTRVLEVAQYLVRAPEMTISATPAALFRLVSMGPITILFDEVDVIFNPHNGGNNEDLRGLLNAGYKRSATIARCVGDAKNMKVERFPVYAPAALAGIAGAMPATITTRAITIHMHRRRTDEPVEPFRERQVARQAQPLREQLAAWIDSTGTQLGDAQPDMPDGVTDRPAEIWEPLLAIADTAGGHWPDTARNACRHFVLDTGPQITSLGVRLLADLRELSSPLPARAGCAPPTFSPPYANSTKRPGAISTANPSTPDGWPENSTATASNRFPISTTARPSRATRPPDHAGWPTPGIATSRLNAPSLSVTPVTAVTPQVSRLPIPDQVTDPSVTAPAAGYRSIGNRRSDR